MKCFSHTFLLVVKETSSWRCLRVLVSWVYSEASWASFICIRSYYLLVFSPLVTLRLAPIVCSKSTCTWWSSPKAHHSVTTYLRNSLVIKRKVVTRKGTGRTAGDEFLCSGLVRFCVQSTARWFLRSPNQQVELWRLSLGLELVLTMYGNIMGAVISWLRSICLLRRLLNFERRISIVHWRFANHSVEVI